MIEFLIKLAIKTAFYEQKLKIVLIFILLLLKLFKSQYSHKISNKSILFSTTSQVFYGARQEFNLKYFSWKKSNIKKQMNK